MAPAVFGPRRRNHERLRQEGHVARRDQLRLAVQRRQRPRASPAESALPIPGRQLGLGARVAGAGLVVQGRARGRQLGLLIIEPAAQELLALARGCSQAQAPVVGQRARDLLQGVSPRGVTQAGGQREQARARRGEALRAPQQQEILDRALLDAPVAELSQAQQAALQPLGPLERRMSGVGPAHDVHEQEVEEPRLARGRVDEQRAALRGRGEACGHLLAQRVEQRLSRMEEERVVAIVRAVDGEPAALALGVGFERGRERVERAGPGRPELEEAAQVAVDVQVESGAAFSTKRRT